MTDIESTDDASQAKNATTPVPREVYLAIQGIANGLPDPAGYAAKCLLALTIANDTHAPAADLSALAPGSRLTLGRVDTIAQVNHLDGTMLSAPRSAYWRSFARNIEREVLGGEPVDGAAMPFDEIDKLAHANGLDGSMLERPRRDYWRAYARDIELAVNGATCQPGESTGADAVRHQTQDQPDSSPYGYVIEVEGVGDDQKGTGRWHYSAFSQQPMEGLIKGFRQLDVFTKPPEGSPIKIAGLARVMSEDEGFLSLQFANEGDAQAFMSRCLVEEGQRNASLPSGPSWRLAQQVLLEEYNTVLRNLAMHLAAGGWNSDGLIAPAAADEKIRSGIDDLVRGAQDFAASTAHTAARLTAVDDAIAELESLCVAIGDLDDPEYAILQTAIGKIRKLKHAPQGAHAKLSEIEPLLGQYWDIAYEEGKSGTSKGSAANTVLSKLRALLVGRLNVAATVLRLRITLGGFAKRLSSSEDCSDIPGKLQEIAEELARLPQPPVPRDQAVGLAKEARECLEDVISHHDDFVKACRTQHKASNESSGPNIASYWEHQERVLVRMKDQAEAALAAAPK
jgi:hypothetical protein